MSATDTKAPSAPPSYENVMAPRGSPEGEQQGLVEVQALPMPPPMDQAAGAVIGVPELDQYPNLRVNQTRKGWIQECFGYEAETEFNIGTMQDPRGQHFYAIEESECLVRTCCPSIRPFTMKVNKGGKDNHPPFLQYERP